MSNAHPSNQDRDEQAARLQRLSGACRTIGAMMEAGIDILSITRVLRSQAQDEDIARLCEHIDFDLKRGRSLVEALADEPTLFSPFAISLVRQGEERNTLPQAFARLAEFLDRERSELLQVTPSTSTSSTRASSTSASDLSADSDSLTPQVLGARAQVLGAGAFDLERAEARWLRVAGGIGAGLLAASAVGEALAASGVAGAKWARPVARLLSAAVLAGAALGARKRTRIEQDAPRNGPQVLGAAVAEREVESEPLPTVDLQAVAPEPVANPVATAEATGVYLGAPHDDDEEEAPRYVPRPRDEEID